ncbi:MAG: hypothetical protein D6730_03400 [Bacteroidetes bacterium]|nr:MAG: hypothetical protein D6730_03400 [Bacteroidota bacterium]
MQVQLLLAQIERFKEYLRKKPDFRSLYAWEALRHFQQHWDIAAADFGAMYARSLQNSQSQRLWKREAWYPREIMLGFIALSPDFVRNMFADLFDENQPLTQRMQRFSFCCDALLEDYARLPGKSREDAHFHHAHMLFVYLALRFPGQYTLFNYEAFRRCMQSVGSRNIPAEFEVERFVKLSRAVYTFMQKDQELLELHRRRLDSRQHYLQPAMLLVDEFYQVMDKA